MICLIGCGRGGESFSFISDDTVWEESDVSTVSEHSNIAKTKDTNSNESPLPSLREDETVRKNDDVTIVEGPQNGTACTTIETRYYTISVPIDWEGYFTYELDYQPEGGYFLAFYELKDHQSFGGGNVMTVGLYPNGEDFSYLPDYTQYGTIITPEGEFAIVILYPTDFQYTMENADIYETMTNQIMEVVDSMVAANNCSIQKLDY